MSFTYEQIIEVENEIYEIENQKRLAETEILNKILTAFGGKKLSKPLRFSDVVFIVPDTIFGNKLKIALSKYVDVEVSKIIEDESIVMMEKAKI